ncbi:MAG: membrane protein insertase YidC, partial [Bradyrhizobium sp.]
IEVDTDRYEAVFTTHGGRLKGFYLKDYRETSARNSPLYNMVKPGKNGVLPLGLVVTRGGEAMSDGQLNYATTAPAKIKVTPGHPVTIILTAHAKNGLNLSKVYTFRDSKYVFNMKGAISGDTAGVSQIGFAMSQSLNKLPGYYDVPELQADVHGKVFTQEEKNLKKGVPGATGKITYAGFGDRYFLSVFLPISPQEGTLAMAFSNGEAHAHLVFTGAATIKSAVYMGPKQIHILESVNPALSKAIDFGWMGIIALPFLRALQIFHYVAPNYGVAIILLTIVVRLLTLPMSIKGQRSMMRMQHLQPQIERIRQKFKDDSERLNREMVDLYKRNHVNPIGGCLPMLIQLPILWGLYEALLNAVELR